MKRRTVLFIPALVMAGLILDSRFAAQSAQSALELCIKTLIPGLFPMFVVSAMLVPSLQELRLPGLCRLLRIPEGCGGIFILGCAGGFPVGAACIAQAAQSGGIGKQDAARMLGFCSFCGPSFLFGILGTLLSPKDALVLFLIQLETALLVALFWPGQPKQGHLPSPEPIGLCAAVKRSVGSMTTVCAWVVLAGVAAGFLQRWLFPLLPDLIGRMLTGLLELTTGVFSLSGLDPELRFLYSAVFVCFGGISVLLQIHGIASQAGIQLTPCIFQKAVQAFAGAALAGFYLRMGAAALVLLPAGVLCAKIAVEIPGRMVYTRKRKEGI